MTGIDLVEFLHHWDNKTTSQLEALYPQLTRDQKQIRQLMKLNSDPLNQIGATWLLKHHLQQGAQINSDDESAFYQNYHDLVDWQSRLHWLQSLPYFAVPASEHKKLYGFLMYAIADDNKFVRAWAYNGLAHLANNHLKYKPQVLLLLEQSVTDEAASVKARIRKAMKQLH